MASRLGLTWILALLFLVASAGGSAASVPTVAGTWRRLPPAPLSVFPSAGVWAGKQLIVLGPRPFTSVVVAQAYDPTARAWRRLPSPPGPHSEPGYQAVWTGKRLLAWGAFEALSFDPASNGWQRLRRSLPTGIVVWTGREAIGWGGGCCGDARSNGAAYDPATGRYRALPPSPLAPSQRPMGAWTGRSLLLFVSGFDPDGKPYPARLARAAAYSPATNTWRRIAPLPGSGLRFSGSAVWDGRELLVAGGGRDSRSALAYNPATNRWRRLASLPAPRVGPAALWTGTRLILWGGQNLHASLRGGLVDGLEYERAGDRWSAIPKAPLRASGSAVWTGRSLLVWGGELGTPAGTSIAPGFPRDGAAFTPRTR